MTAEPATPIEHTTMYDDTTDLVGKWVLVTTRGWEPGSWREVIGLCSDTDVVAITVQPVEPIGRELIPGALFVLPWREVVQVVGHADGQEQLRALVDVVLASRAR